MGVLVFILRIVFGKNTLCPRGIQVHIGSFQVHFGSLPFSEIIADCPVLALAPSNLSEADGSGRTVVVAGIASGAGTRPMRTAGTHHYVLQRAESGTESAARAGF